MIFWLDNQGNRDGAINENWGRELLELFSLGVGNYSEDDIREAARAFTGWTIAPKIPRNPYGRFHWLFDYKPEDHDDREKTFLGYTGNFNGEDIVDIIADSTGYGPVPGPSPLQILRRRRAPCRQLEHYTTS